MNRASYIRLQERYGGRFIAQRDGKVVAHGATYRSLIKSLGKKRLKREGLVFSYINPKHAVCIYYVSS